MSGFKFALGSMLRDSITGYAGVVMGRTEYLYGCTRYTLQSKTLDKDGKPQEWASFDEPQLEEVPAAHVAGRQTTGGPQPAVTRGR